MRESERLIKAERDVQTGGETCPSRRSLRRILCCGLICGYREHKSFTSIHISSAVICSHGHTERITKIAGIAVDSETDESH